MNIGIAIRLYTVNGSIQVDSQAMADAAASSFGEFFGLDCFTSDVEEGYLNFSSSVWVHWPYEPHIDELIDSFHKLVELFGGKFRHNSIEFHHPGEVPVVSQVLGVSPGAVLEKPRRVVYGGKS